MVTIFQVTNSSGVGLFMGSHVHRRTRVRKLMEHKNIPNDSKWILLDKVVIYPRLERDTENSSIIQRPIMLGKTKSFERNIATEIGDRQDSVNDSLAILIVNDRGLIQHCNKRGGELLGCQPCTLIWKPVSAILPQLGEMTLISNEQINPRLRFLARIGHRFDVIGRHGVHLKCELFFIHKECRGHHYLQVIIRPVEMVASRLQ